MILVRSENLHHFYRSKSLLWIHKSTAGVHYTLLNDYSWILATMWEPSWNACFELIVFSWVPRRESMTMQSPENFNVSWKYIADGKFQRPENLIAYKMNIAVITPEENHEHDFIWNEPKYDLHYTKYIL